jgi:PilZ domain
VFVQTAYARDTSFYGARVDGIECLKGPGEIIQITYKHQTAKFRVMWVGQPRTKEQGHIGLRCLEPRKNIWGIEQVPAARPPQLFLDASLSSVPGDTESQSLPSEKPLSSRPERRRYTRHRCLGTAEFRIAGNCTTISGKLIDLSLGGCYIKVPGTCLPGTPLELVLAACDLRIQLNGRVAVAQSSKGMGVEFVSGCDGLKQLPGLIEAVRRRFGAMQRRSVAAPSRVQRTKPAT